MSQQRLPLRTSPSPSSSVPEARLVSEPPLRPWLLPPSSRLELYATFQALGAESDPLREQIAGLLGRSWPAFAQKTLSDHNRSTSGNDNQSSDQTGASSQLDRPPSDTPPHPTDRPVIQPQGSLRLTGPVEPLPLRAPAEPLPSGTCEAPLPLEPLLTPLETRAILSTLLSTLCATGAPDVTKLTQGMVRGETFRRLPLAQRWSLRRGIQLLVDVAEPLVGLLEDEQLLLDAVRDVVGLSVERLRFSEFPELAGVGARHRWSPWQPPPPQVPVLVVSALGIYFPDALAADQQAMLERWEQLALRLDTQGSPLLVLTPTPPDWYPQALQRVVSLLHWDQATRTRHARALQRRRSMHGA